MRILIYDPLAVNDPLATDTLGRHARDGTWLAGLPACALDAKGGFDSRDTAEGGSCYRSPMSRCRPDFPARQETQSTEVCERFPVQMTLCVRGTELRRTRKLPGASERRTAAAVLDNPRPRRRSQRDGTRTPAEPPPRRTGSAAARIRPSPRNSRPVAAPMLGLILMLGSSGEVSTITNDC